MGQCPTAGVPGRTVVSDREQEEEERRKGGGRGGRGEGEGGVVREE